MADIRIPLDVPSGEPIPEIENAMRAGLKVVRASWREIASGHVSTGAYLAALKSQDALHYPYRGDKDAAAVVNTAPYADVLEKGHGGFHLPSHWGRRRGVWRVNAKGGYYQIVPMRHYSPYDLPGGSTTTRRRRVLPRQVYALASILPYGARLTAFGDLYKQSKSYVYYRQIFPTFPPDLLGDPAPFGYEWKASPYENLYRFTRPTPGGGWHTEYMTFRTITPQSQGWYIPPLDALRLAERALDQARPALERMLEAAAAQAAARMIAQAGKELDR